MRKKQTSKLNSNTSSIYLKKSNIPNSGRGVFAGKNFGIGEIIEVAPILILEFSDFTYTKWNLLFEYYFWMDDYVSLALGFGSLYNHSKNANAKYKLDRKKETITFTASKDIKKDQEILFNYKGKANPKTPLWFERKK